MTENTEYIEREAARRAIEHADPAFCYVLDYVPTADVEEVRHGAWLKTGDRKLDIIYACHKCSECGHVFGGDTTKYCGHCGAKMDGKQEE